MELYSSSPPHIAPNKFAAIMLDISPFDFSKVENTMPEKNTGEVRTMAVPKRPAQVEGNPPAFDIHQPADKVANNST